MSRPECRRCESKRVLLLDKKRRDDNYIYRCRECGFLFSPPKPSAPHTQHTAMKPGYSGGGL